MISARFLTTLALLFSFDALAAKDDPMLESQVRVLIRDMAVPSKQNGAVEGLSRLGDESVPFIVKYMDDRRKMPNRHIALPNNHPGAFEAVRQYSGDLVVDHVAYILNHITGFHTTPFDTNHDYDRVKIVAQWQEWCAKNYPDRAGTCWSSAQAWKPVR